MTQKERDAQLRGMLEGATVVFLGVLLGFLLGIVFK